MSLIQELFDVVTGNVYWVDSAANSTNATGSFNRPLLTIQAGVDKCTASNGDLVLVKPGHAETITSQIDFDKAGVTVRGLGKGNLRPTLTPNGAIDCIDVSAANMSLENVIFASPGTDAQTADVNVDAAGFTLLNTKHVGSETDNNKVSYVTVTANGDDCLLKGMRANTSVVAMVIGIDVAAATRVEIDDCTITGNASVGYTSGTVADSGTASDLVIHHSTLANIGAAGEGITLGNNSIGAVWKCRISSRHDTIANANSPGTGADSFETYATANVSKNGAIAPVVDAD